MCLALAYLPALRRMPEIERARSMTLALPSCVLLAVAGGFVMTLSIPFVVLRRQLPALPVVSEPVLLLGAAILAGLSLTSAFLLGTLRWRLSKELKKYVYVSHRIENAQTTEASGYAAKMLMQQIRQRESRVTRKRRQLASAARWTAIMGVGVVLCVSLPVAFAIVPVPAAAIPRTPVTSAASQPFSTALLTTDTQFSITLTVTPNHFGPNVFRMSVANAKTRAVSTKIRVSLSLTMLDMNMGTAILPLQDDGKGQFSGTGNISMTGNWAIGVLIRTADATIHEARVRLLTPY